MPHKAYVPRDKPDPEKHRRGCRDDRGKAERPIFYTGGGVVNSGPVRAMILRELARITGAPVTSTLMGLGHASRLRRSNGSACWACTARSKPIWR